MNDDPTMTIIKDRLAEVRDSLGQVSRSIPASEIIARAGRRRTRRWLASAGAACAAAGLTLGLVLPAGSPARPVHAHLAAWSVDANPNGTVTFRLENTSHPRQLQHALAAAGVAAFVRWGEICLARGWHVLLPTQGIIRTPGVHPQPGSEISWIGPGKIMNWLWVITPAKMPTGSHFVISAIPRNRTGRGDIQAEWELVPTSAHVACAKSVRPF